MKKVKLIAVLAALAAGLCLYLFLQKSAEPVETPMATVVTAAADIRENTVITEEMLVYETIAAEAVQTGAATDMAQVVGRVANAPLLMGEQIQLRRLVDLVDTDNITALSYSIPVGMRAMTISVGTTSGVAGMLLPGNCVDIMVIYSVEYTAVGDAEPEITGMLDPPASVVYAGAQDETESVTETPAPETETASGESPSDEPAAPTDEEEQAVVTTQKTASQLLMQNVPILAIEKVLDKNGLNADGSQASYGTVTLCLTPEQVLWLNLAQNTGNIMLVLRSPVDDEQLTLDFVTMTPAQ